jgi:hypothetical protein
MPENQLYILLIVSHTLALKNFPPKEKTLQVFKVS